MNQTAMKLVVHSQMYISEMKHLILQHTESCEGSYIRLIFQGKLLANDQLQLKDYKLLTDQSFVHCVITKHGPVATDDRQSQETEEEQQLNPASLRGFDRLRVNMGQDEVQALRLYFYPQVAAQIAASEVREGESAEDRIYRVEEEWIGAQGPQSEYILNVGPLRMNNNTIAIDMLDGYTEEVREGTSVDFMWGFVMGLLLGFILLFWLWERSVSRKQKLGIVVGVMTNIFITILQKNQLVNT